MIINEQDYIEHFGVKGMRWGVRNDDRPSGVSSRTNREARKDAAEFARAKMFYGKGAGTRRKLIKGTVEAKRKKDPSYSKAFDHHLEKQDMSTHASKARRERGRKDTKERTRKTSGALARRFTGEMGTNAAFVAIAATGVAYLNSPQGRAKLNQGFNAIKNKRTSSKMVKDLEDFLRRS
jgi:hypothetical protein